MTASQTINAINIDNPRYQNHQHRRCKISLPSTSTKFTWSLALLCDRYIGPCFITEEVSPVAFRLMLPLGVRIHDVVHANLQERWNVDKNRPTVRSQLRLCTMRSDLKSTKYSMWLLTTTARDFCSKFVGRHRSTYLARTLGSPCEESTTCTYFLNFFERMFIENFLGPLTSWDFAIVGLQEPPRNQDPEYFTARTLVLKEGRVSYHGPFI
jgi:hypothetical protein